MIIIEGLLCQCEEDWCVLWGFFSGFFGFLLSHFSIGFYSFVLQAVQRDLNWTLVVVLDMCGTVSPSRSSLEG